MPPNPIGLLLALPVIVGMIWVLAALPVYPRSKILVFIWVSSLAIVCSILIYGHLNPHPLQHWTAPKRSAFVSWALILLPFAASFVLWRLSIAEVPRVNSQTSVLLVILVCLLSQLAVRQFKNSCVFHEYRNDHGTAWCPETWQAVRG